MFKVNKCRKTILSYADLISKYYYDHEFVVEKMNELYLVMKEMAPLFSKDGMIMNNYASLVKALISVEQQLPHKFILENAPYYDFTYNVSKNEIVNCNEEEIVNYIVHRTRSFLLAHYSVDGDLENVNLGKIDFLGDCIKACQIIDFVCQAIKIPCKIYTIYPAFCSEFNVYDKGGIHQFCLIKIGEKEYIIDVTYSQFFLIRENNLNRIGIPLLGGCNVGIYMTFDEKRKSLAEQLMRDGYVKALDENLKLYLDGFAISYRNGLYYENKGYVSFTTDYTPQDYKNFLEERDSQVNHENVSELGRQRRLLKENFNIKR